MNNWDWIRYAGLGPWKDKNAHYCCPNCGKRMDGTKPPKAGELNVGLMFIDKSRSDQKHTLDIKSRVIGDDGHTVLKGREGLKYMEMNAATTPGYVNRLKDYHKDKTIV